MLKAAALLLLLLALPAASVGERGGNIHYTGADGVTRTLTEDGRNAEPALAPDGRTIAFIHIDQESSGAGEPGIRTLWIADGPNRSLRRLAEPQEGKDPTEDFRSVSRPVFSLDGGYVYVSAAAWVTSEAVHQVSVATGKRRFVVDGWVNAVIRTGRYRGYLLVGRHKYHPAPHYGSFNPVYVVRPDNKESFMVPGSDKDDGERSVDAWLKAKGWKAW